MYERDTIRWRQKLARAEEMHARHNDARSASRLEEVWRRRPDLNHYVASPEFGCVAFLFKLAFMLVAGIIGCALLWAFAAYFLFRMIFI